MANILVLHGPNLNLLGLRQPEIYGAKKLTEVNQDLQTLSDELGHEITIKQSNAEAEICVYLHASLEESTDYIIFNPAAFTHTSIVLRDALLAIAKPFIEVHISNLFKREAFRQFSYFSDIAMGTISGFGTDGYLLALQQIHRSLTLYQPRRGV